MTKPYAPGHDEFSDPLRCQTTRRLPYLTDHLLSECRIGNGESQTFCNRCKRYRWLEELCGEAETGEGKKRRNDGRETTGSQSKIERVSIVYVSELLSEIDRLEKEGGCGGS